MLGPSTLPTNTAHPDGQGRCSRGKGPTAGVRGWAQASQASCLRQLLQLKGPGGAQWHPARLALSALPPGRQSGKGKDAA